MATIGSPAFPSQVDMIEESLDVVADSKKNESIHCNNGENIEHENSVEQHVIYPRQDVEPELHSPRVIPSLPDHDSANDPPSSLTTELAVPEDSTRYEKSAKPQPQPSSAAPSLIPMSCFVDLTDLALHSPSSQIVGTPFATDSTRFEYPFPDIGNREPSVSPSVPLSNAAITQNDPNTGHPIHPLSAPHAVSTAFSTSPASISLASYDFPHGEISVSYNPAHPKLKQYLNPPVPPSLAKKSRKWSLNLMGRRKSSGQSTGSSTSSTVSEFSSNASTPAGSVAHANLIFDGALSASPPPPISSLHSNDC